MHAKFHSTRKAAFSNTRVIHWASRYFPKLLYKHACRPTVEAEQGRFILIMGTSTNSLLAIIIILLALQCSHPITMACIQSEREVLLEFKSGLKDPFGRLSSWAGVECCGWQGVKCSNRTGHIVRLDLRNTFQPSDSAGSPKNSMALGGEISPSLLHLKHLNYLDLSMNNFGDITIPAFIGSLARLRYLNLSSTGFSGLVPHQLGNLSNLHYLDLSRNDQNALYLDTGRWLSHLSSLLYLNFNSVDLSKTSTTWLESLNELPSLSEMHLPFCQLSVPLHLSHVNFTYLRVLDLSGNFINSTIPLWLFQITGLRYLDLSYNSFQNTVPASIGNLTSLQVLHLSSNGFITDVPASLGNLCMLSDLDFSQNKFGGQFSDLKETFSGCIKDSLKTLVWEKSNLTGHLPYWLGNLKNLEILDLSGNLFYGPFPAIKLISLQVLDLGNNQLNETVSETLGLFSELVNLDLSNNYLEGVLSEAHFSNLNQLEYLDVSSNSLTVVVGSDWAPPPRLTDINFQSCKVGPAFPAWLRKLENLSSIDMSSAEISDTMPDWFWNFSSIILDIDLSRNEIKGVLPVSLRHLNLRYVDLSNNQFKGPIPQFTSRLQELYLSNNSLSGAIYPNIGEIMPGMLYLALSANNINSSIPFSICKQKHLITLDLSKNQLSGGIPNCWDHKQELMVMDLSYNSLSGSIPTSICSLSSFQSLHLSNNDLSGEIPLTLKSCTGMTTLDLGQNKLGGSIPTWIGEDLLLLETLRLRNNLFHGNIPPELGSLNELKVIDFAHNKLSGTIPLNLGNLSAIKAAHQMSNETYFGYVDNIEVHTKGRDYVYNTLLPLLMSIDLAENNLIGEIPEELTTLSGLQNLNLSGNQLTGRIPDKIGELQWLESLDLSVNKLSGAIPTSMAAMHSLGHLNLSYNRFSGKIPSSGQFEALPDPSIYIGNNNLCGFPLNVSCQDDATSQAPKPVNNDESDSEMVWFYLSMAPGFVVGFWVVIGTLLLSMKWRIIHFRFVDSVSDKLYAIFVKNVNKRKSGSHFRRA